MTFLEKTKSYLEQKYFGKILLDSIDIDTNKPIKKEAPAFLFRGENRFNGNLLSSRTRFINNKKLLGSAKREIEELASRIDSILRDNTLNPMWSASLLQHYGFPTEVIDATSNLDVLAGFIVSNNLSGFGRIYVYPTKSLSENSIVIDLSEIDFARRPIRQNAYTLFHREYINFKHPVVLDKVQVEVFEFTVTNDDIDKYYMDDYLYEEQSDNILELLKQIIKYGAGIKISEPAKNWLEKNVFHGEILPKEKINIDKNNIGELHLSSEKYISFLDWKKTNRI